MEGRALWLTVSIVGLAVACGGGRHVYAPVDGVREPESGQVLLRRVVPAQQPRGEILLASFGVTPIELTKGARPMPFLHVRMAVSNQDGRGPWLIDVRDQMLELRGAGRSRPALINTAGRAASPPELGIDAHGMRVVDLFYALPSAQDVARDVPDFGFHMRLALEDGTGYEDHAYFVRTKSVEGAKDQRPASWSRSLATIGVGWGELWWYDPMHVSVAFARPRVPHDAHPFLMFEGRHTPYRVSLSPDAVPRSLAAAPGAQTVR